MDPNAGPTRRSYDRIAASYRDRFERELDDKPFDREFLDAVVTTVAGRGPVIDLGSGPGQIGAYLAKRGVPVVSLDLSNEMLRQSAPVLPDASPVQADLRMLPLLAGSINAVVAFYSLIHVPPEHLDGTIRELGRVLRPDGTLGITTHVAPPADRVTSPAAPGGGSLHLEEMLDAPVDLTFYFYPARILRRSLEAAGFTLLRCTERDPYQAGVEAQTRRAYVLARKSG